MKAISIFLLSVALSANAAKLDLTGQVSGSDGAVLAGATVFIYTAGPKQGTSSFCPSCYADCAKKAQTDAQGRFQIPSLDPTLVFRLLTVAAGHESQFTPRVDPAQGEVKIAMKPLSAEAMKSPLRIKGLVIGENGRPIASATIGPEGVGIGDTTHWGGSDEYVDPVAVSDEHGHFVIFCKPGADKIYAVAEGRGFAQRWVEFKPGGDYVVRLEDGVAVTGRILNHGQPVPGVTVSVCTKERECGKYLDCAPIATGADGRFLIANVPPDNAFSFCAAMNSLQGKGAIPIQAFTAGHSGSMVDLGDVVARPGCRVEGKIELSDGKPIPPGTRLLLSRENVRDSLTRAVGADGSFQFRDVPAGSIGLSLRLNGYIFSKRNPSLDWLNGGIVGTVRGDVTHLELLMEPGHWKFDNHPADGPADGNLQPSGEPLRGVRVTETARK